MADKTAVPTPKGRKVNEEINEHNRVTIMVSPHGRRLYPLLAKFVNSDDSQTKGITISRATEEAWEMYLKSKNIKTPTFDWEQYDVQRKEARTRTSEARKKEKAKNDHNLGLLQAFREAKNSKDTTAADKIMAEILKG